MMMVNQYFVRIVTIDVMYVMLKDVLNVLETVLALNVLVHQVNLMIKLTPTVKIVHLVV